MESFKNDDNVEDDSINNLILFGNNGKKQPYLVIDYKSNGYIVRVFNQESNRTSKMKHDLIQVIYQ
jgi:hypothetical protein